MLKAPNKFVSACAYELPLRPPQFRICISNQGMYLTLMLFEMNTAMDTKFFLPSLMIVWSLLGSSFTKCPPSDYSAPNGTVHHSGFTDDNNLTCTFNIRVPVSRRAVLEIKKLKVMGRMPNCENGSLEIRVG